MEIDVLTFNIHHGVGIDKEANLERIAQVLEKSEADIIGLNEVDKYFSKRSLFEDQTRWLAKQLNTNYFFSPSLSFKSKTTNKVRQYGNALLSRFPIVSKKSHSFNYMPGLIEGRSLLDATIQIDKQLYQIMVTHLSLNPFLHRKQTDFIIKQIHKYPHPIILMGDWNMKPGSKGWKKLSDKVQDSWHVSGMGPGYTYPSSHPKMRLDYIFVSPELRVVQSQVITYTHNSSDHLPLKATISCH
ncbi:endonuclease/exonuclease/phosphatase family protein [uncultured Metabacillus sp.]|uniref:endonuclease/exonuclease/phosphatase family protein n=1 Tax=uncultured Metabacillus sp. TaxID=2860135 RepID=UPI002627A3CF|nr:endonuclease/exonuclease/phosphatase family protein [uncultured Metabacillus sp.]